MLNKFGNDQSITDRRHFLLQLQSPRCPKGAEKKVSAQSEKKNWRLPGQMFFRAMDIQKHGFYSVKSSLLTFGWFQILKNI